MKSGRSWLKMYIIFIIVTVFFICFFKTDKKYSEFVVESLSYTVSLIANDDNGINTDYEQKEALEKEEQPVVDYKKYSGDLTGYSADCKACNGTLACMPKYNVYKNGVTTYSDKDFGKVNIVATSKNIPCGSIIKFNGEYAIVLDRGVLNYDVDLLVESESYALQYVGRSKISYELIRSGW